MGYKEVEIKVPLTSTDGDVKALIAKKTGIKEFRHRIIRKSLDARNKRNIYWQYKVGIQSDAIKNDDAPDVPEINIPRKKHQSKAMVVGSGPAGIFNALVLAQAGLKTTLIEQGSKVCKRREILNTFEKTGELDETNNYANGEGGAGTFSDGKLTSRTKGISKEKNYIFRNFIEAGAPEEILYMTHPHLGSDNLFYITENLRKKFEDYGGEILFETKLENIKVINGKVSKAITNQGDFDVDYLFIAPGHSSYETYKMLMRKGVHFQAKNFAIGMRAEHSQQAINNAQWGVPRLPGVKAAEYRLTSNNAKKPVYSFCMCPGGMVVPATPYKHTNIVNGMSLYQRNNNFANAAVVAGTHPNELVGKEVSPFEALEWLEKLEASFFNFSNSYNAPAVKIADFLSGKFSQDMPKSSYPFELLPADFTELMPKSIIENLKIGLKSFCYKLKGYDQGTLIGLESKTSSPIQVLRDRQTLFTNIDNLIVAGEGSGWAGGIVSSAADGVKAAMSVLSIAK